MTCMAKTRQGTRAVIYTRISEDRDNEAEGVDRQRESCEKLAADRGLDVVGYYEDNDRSAMHGKRPRYRAMLQAVRDGQVDVILAVRTDRVYRLVTDLIGLTEVLKATDVPVFTVKSGDVDLSTADGRMRANIMGAVAQHSSEVAGERISDAAQQRAQRGRFMGGQRRFGYQQLASIPRRVRDRVTGEYRDTRRPTGPLTLVPEEADAIAWGYAHIARGGSLEAVVREWRGRGLQGPQGTAFTGTAVRDVLLRPMNGGIVTYKEQEIPGAEPEVPAIVSAELYRTATSILRNDARKTGPGRPALTLLAPVLRCAVCGGKMSGAQRGRKANGEPDLVYQCRAKAVPALGITGNHVSRLRHKLDAHVEEAVLMFATDRAGELRAPATDATGAVAEAARDAEALRGKLAAFQAAAADMDPLDYAAATRAVRAKLAAVEQRITVAVGNPALSALVQADDIRLTWEGMTVDQRRAVIVGLVESITVGRGTPGRSIRDVTMDNVTVQWKALG